jgi:hypothetical protein
MGLSKITQGGKWQTFLIPLLLILIGGWAYGFPFACLSSPMIYLILYGFKGRNLSQILWWLCRRA